MVSSIKHRGLNLQNMVKMSLTLDSVTFTFGAIRTLLAPRDGLCCDEEGVNWTPEAGRNTGGATGSWTGTK